MHTPRRYGAIRRALATISAMAALLLAVAIPLTSTLAASAQEGPTIEIRPSVATPGSELAVTGSGFVGDDCVDLAVVETATSFGPRLATVGVATDGSFFGIITVPEDLTGGQWVVRAFGYFDDIDGPCLVSGNEAVADFDVVLPTITVDPAAAAPGSTVTVTGENFIGGRFGGPDCVELTLLDGLSLFGEWLGIANVEPDATFTAEVTIPDTTALGAQTIEAIAYDRDEGNCVIPVGNVAKTGIDITLTPPPPPPEPTPTASPTPTPTPTATPTPMPVVEADLAITKTAAATTAVAGETITWTVSATNGGPSVATDVVVTDDLPAQGTLAAVPAGCDLVGDDLVCGFAAVAVGETVAVEVTMAVDADVTTPITNQASVTSAIVDPQPANNQASVTTPVIAVADLEILAVEILDVPIEGIIGNTYPVTVRTTFVNQGPSSPVAAELTTSVSADPGPQAITTTIDAVTGAPQYVDAQFVVSCEAAGTASISADAAIAPNGAVDPDSTNDQASTTAAFECAVPVALNVRPGNQFNRISIDDTLVRVAVLSTEAGEYGLPYAFDATTIVFSSVRFGDAASVDAGAGAPRHKRVHLLDSFELDDKTKDGDIDARFGFRTPLTGLAIGDTEACIRGQFVEGGETFTFVGCDVVTVTP